MVKFTVRPYTIEDREPAFQLRRLAFGGPRISAAWEAARDGWRGFVVEDARALAGFARVHAHGQFFGGRSVPMGGVAAVCVAPHARGHGIAGQLLRACLESMREHGQAISALFASVPPLYRANGWEYCGVGQSVSLRPEFLRLAGKPVGEASIRRPRESDVDSMRKWYTEFASGVDGMLDRDELGYPAADVLSADVGELVDGRGYLTARRENEPWLQVQDFIARDRDTALALLGSLASWSGQLDEVRLPVLDPAVHDLVLGWPEFSTVYTHPWMLRVVDLEAALHARGWPSAELLRPAAVDIELIDEVAPWQAGRYRIEVDGEVGVHRGGSGAVRFTARGIAAWFGGTATMDSLRRNGLAAGDREHDAVLDTLTGAPRVPRLGNHVW
ncbi:GNAT family N-acetyltransferase [Sciscionella marina]|uniref:GNAT family N-acetyltransferase n=1 Tax=Sciscionella marina TaxID=508770 RepID=UPI0003686251|nr:GNAT family N-acetyltransferase [Sciscionella marina]